MKVEIANNKVILLPDFFLIGAGKSGTTSLAKYLSEHPEIYIPKEKELHFFLFAENPPFYYKNHILGPVLITDFSKYLSFFNLDCEENDLKIGDCSVTYMYSRAYRRVIKNIKKYYPQEKWKNLKFIVILRDPVERAFSQYITRLFDKENKPFLEACFEWQKREKEGWSIAYDYLGFSFYYEPLKGYINAFGKENVKIYLYEDLKERPVWLVKEIFSFLNVNIKFLPQSLGKAYNISGVPKEGVYKIIYNLGIYYNPFKFFIKQFFPENFKIKIRKIVRKIFYYKPQLPIEARKKLIGIFKDDILKLQELINRDLTHWLK